MKKVYLHVGLHKTATTSFQLTCKKNKEKLSEQGFVYPLFNSLHINLKDIENHSVPFFSLYSDTPKTYHLNIKFKAFNIEELHKDYSAIIETALNSKDNVIFSGEDISILNLKNLQKLKSFLEIYNIEIIPFAVVRSPYAYACSVKQEKVRSGQYVGDSFVTASPTIKKLQMVFPDIRFYPFSRLCAHSYGPSGFLFEEMGIEYKDFQFVKANEGLSNTIARVQNLLSKKNPYLVNNRINYNYISAVHLDSKQFNQSFLLTEEEFTCVKGVFHEENVFIRNNLGEEFLDKNIRFAKEDATLKLCEWLFEELEKKYECQIAEKINLLEAQHNEEKLRLFNQFEELEKKYECQITEKTNLLEAQHKEESLRLLKQFEALRNKI